MKPVEPIASSILGLDHMTEKTPQKLPEALLQLLHEQPELSFFQMAELVGKAEDAVKRAICELREAGHLVRINPDKGGQTRLTESVGYESSALLRVAPPLSFSHFQASDLETELRKP